MAQAKPVLTNDDVAPELLASSIVIVAEGAKALLGSRLTKRAVLLLVQDACPGSISLANVEMVLNAAADLRRYVK